MAERGITPYVHVLRWGHPLKRTLDRMFKIAPGNFVEASARVRGPCGENGITPRVHALRPVGPFEQTDVRSNVQNCSRQFCRTLGSGSRSSLKAISWVALLSATQEMAEREGFEPSMGF